MNFTKLHVRTAAALSCISLMAAPTLRAQDVYSSVEPKPLTLADGSRPAEDDIVLPPSEGPTSSTSLSDAKNLRDSKNPSVITNDDGGISATPHKFHYAFRLNLRGVYDDNIFLTEDNPESGYYFAIEPGLTLGYGDIVARQENYIRLDYAPSIFIFPDHSDADGVQHLIRLEGQHRFSRLTLTFAQDVQILDGTHLNAIASGGATGGAPSVNLDAGGTTALNMYNSIANFSYDLSGKTFLSGGLQFQTWDYENDFVSSSVFSGNLFFNYNYSPKLVVGIGGTGGYNWVDSPSPDQTFEQINVRMTYQLTGKISLNASVGVEFRQFEDNDDDHVSPIYEIGATYQPFDGTNISLRGSRHTMNSAVFAEQDYATTSIVFGVTQRLFQRVYLGLTAGYENSDYFSTVDFASANRCDDYYFVQPAVDVMVTRWLSVGAYYLHRENESNAAGFSFTDNQVGVRASFSF